MIKRIVRFVFSVYSRRRIKKSIAKMDSDTAEISKRYNSPKLTEKEISIVNNFWISHFGFKPGISFFELTKKIDSFNPEYIPDSIYYSFILSRLNRINYSFALSDKGLIDYYFQKVGRPNEVIKNINGNFIKNGKIVTRDEAVNVVVEHKSQMIIKPSIDSSCGKNVEVLGSDVDIDKIVSLFNSYDRDYVIQELVQQSAQTACFNPTSLNTFRITTLLLNNKFSILSSVFRCGGLNSCVDNAGAGGIIIGLDNNGVMHKIGYTKSGDMRDCSFVGKKFEGFQFVGFEKILNLSKELHSLLPFCPIVGWDIALDKSDTPILIEVNLKSPGILFEQMCTGPIMGNRLEEVLDFVKK